MAHGSTEKAPPSYEEHSNQGDENFTSQSSCIETEPKLQVSMTGPENCKVQRHEKYQLSRAVCPYGEATDIKNLTRPTSYPAIKQPEEH